MLVVVGIMPKLTQIKEIVIPLNMLLEFGDYATKIPLQAISGNSRNMPENF